MDEDYDLVKWNWILSFSSLLSKSIIIHISYWFIKFEWNRRTRINQKDFIFSSKPVPTRWPQLSPISTNLVSAEKKFNSDHKKFRICVKNLIDGSKIFKYFQKILRKPAVLLMAFLDQKSKKFKVSFVRTSRKQLHFFYCEGRAGWSMY